MTPPVVLLIGALDTKGIEYAFVSTRLRSQGIDTLIADTSVLGEPRGDLRADITSDELAEAAGTTRGALRDRGDRGAAMIAMARGASVVVGRAYEQGRFKGVLGLGGTGGTSVISAAMRDLPIGVPKVLVSTAASGDTRPIVGTRDIVLVPSVVDVAGINRISRLILGEAADAIAGMVRSGATTAADDRPVVAISMFGNTTECVEACRSSLEDDGYEVLVFHCTGIGGQTMEGLVRDGLVAGVLDITTTEWADELCGGVFSAGPARLDAPGAKGIPHLVVPGCLDMVNFGPRESVPDRYADRRFHVWNPTVTLMRTDPDENSQLGRIIGEKVNAAAGPIAVLLPRRGLSILDTEGNDFWWPEADEALFRALHETVRPSIPVIDIDADINATAFSDAAVETFRSLLSTPRNG